MWHFEEAHSKWPLFYRYLLAAALFLIALLLRVAIAPIEGGVAFVTFYPAIIIGFYISGKDPGTFLAVLSGLAGEYFFIAPYGAFSENISDYGSLAMFSLTTFLIGFFITRLHSQNDQQRNLASKLSLSEERYRRLTAIAADWYWEQDSDLRFIGYGGRRNQPGGMAPEVHLAKRRWELPHTVPVNTDWESHRALLAKREPFSNLILKRVNEKGSDYYVSVSGEPFFNADGQFSGYIGVASDITDQKLAEAAISKLNQELEERVEKRTAALELAKEELESFSYSVAHDLRAPLRAINGFSTMLEEASKDKLDQSEIGYLKRIRVNSERMGELIDDLLNLTRVSRREILRRDVDFSKLALGVIVMLTETHPERNVQVTVQPGIHVNADPSLLQVVLNNLIGNAWKFTAKTDAAKIEIGAEQRDNTITYFVHDNGAGFDMEYAHKLFTPFQRLHGREEFEGTGIGLSLVKRIITKHGGKLWAESTKGQGATFYFTFG